MPFSASHWESPAYVVETSKIAPTGRKEARIQCFLLHLNAPASSVGSRRQRGRRETACAQHVTRMSHARQPISGVSDRESGPADLRTSRSAFLVLFLSTLLFRFFFLPIVWMAGRHLVRHGIKVIANFPIVSCPTLLREDNFLCTFRGRRAANNFTDACTRHRGHYNGKNTCNHDGGRPSSPPTGKGCLSPSAGLVPCFITSRSCVCVCERFR